MIQVADEASWGELSSLFTTCTPLDGANDMDVKSFMELLIDNLAGIVQYNGLQTQDIFSVLDILTITLMSDHHDHRCAPSSPTRRWAPPWRGWAP